MSGETKACKVCKEYKPVEDFSLCVPKGGKKPWRSSYCLPCESLRKRAKKYGISIEEVRKVANKPCESCGRYEHEIGGKSPMSIDHCHGSGRVRGVLCRYCNVALGMLLDDPVRIEQLKQYAILHAQKDHETTTEGEARSRSRRGLGGRLVLPVPTGN